MNPTFSWLILGAAAFGVAADTGIPRNFDIPAQPLASALTSVARQSDLQLLYADDNLKGKRSPEIKGPYTPEQAIGKLLGGTDLSYALTAANTISIKPARISMDSGALPRVIVNAKGGSDESDPWSPNYTAKNSSTATKTDTPLMRTPVNVQVVPKAVLDDQQTIRLTEALRNVSGVQVGQGSGGLSDEIVIRGFRMFNYFRNGFRIDTYGASTGTRPMANVDRIEVIKGPAAVMYGRLEPGGMVNLVTKQPLASPYYSLQQQFGSFDLFRTTADASGPLLKDKSLLYRMNFSYESSGSFRELVDTERTFFAPIVTWNLSPDTQISLEMEYRHDHLNYDSMTWPYLNGQFIHMPRSQNLMERTPSPVDDVLVGMNWSHRFNENWRLSQRFAADLMDNDQGWTLAGADNLNPDGKLPRVYYRVPGEQDTYFTTIDLTGHFDTYGFKHTLLLGGDYYRQDENHRPGLGDLYPIAIYNPIHDARLLNPIVPVGRSDFSTDFFGLYLQDQIELPYGVHALGGLRYQYVRQWDNIADVGLTNDDAVTPRIGLLWQAQPWFSLYGNYVESFGSSNGQTASLTPLPPESARQWEIGAKAEAYDGRLSATLAYYDLTKRNVATADPSNPAFSIAIGEAQSHGVELDLRGEILPGWNLIATYANMDSTVTKNNDGWEGKRLWAVPRNIGSLWSTYEFRQDWLDGIKLGGGFTFHDASSANFEGTESTPGYGTVDLMAAYGWTVGKSRISLQFNLNNLLDKHYFQDAYVSGASTRATIGTPRSFLGALRIDY